MTKKQKAKDSVKKFCEGWMNWTAGGNKYYDMLVDIVDAIPEEAAGGSDVAFLRAHISALESINRVYRDLIDKQIKPPEHDKAPRPLWEGEVSLGPYGAPIVKAPGWRTIKVREVL